MSDIFVKAFKLTESKEDLFTECLAGTLREDSRLAREFLVTLCGNQVDGVSLQNTAISIATQQVRGNCCVDMVFSLDRGKTIGVENKLESPEGKDQLARYLALGFSRLAFITGFYTKVGSEVSRNERYVRPSKEREHFLWSDFYQLLDEHTEAAPAAVLTRALRELFAYLGFDPPKPEIGDLLDSDPERSRENRLNFTKLWEPARAGLRERRWTKITPGSIAELYVSKGTAKRVQKAWLDPTWTRGNLRIRLTPNRGVAAEGIERLLAAAELPQRNAVRISRRDVKDRKTPETVVEVAISLKRLLGGEKDHERMARTLAEFTLAVFDAAG